MGSIAESTDVLVGPARADQADLIVGVEETLEAVGGVQWSGW